MYTQCPNCRTIFEIDEVALQAALGIVRCGHCAKRFDALRTLAGELPAEPDATLPERDPEKYTPTLTQAVPPPTIRSGRERGATAGQDPAPSPEPNPASAMEPRAEVPGAAPTTQPAIRDDATWFVPFAAPPARAVVARPVDIPPGAQCGDPAWLVLELRTQAQHAGRDTIKVVPPAAAILPPDPATADRTDSRAASRTPADAMVPALDALPADDASTAIPADVAAAGEDSVHAGEPANPAGIEAASVQMVPPPRLLLAHADAGAIAAATAPDEPPAAAKDAAPGEPLADADALQPEVAPVDAGLFADTGEAAIDDAGGVAPVYIAPRRRRIRRDTALFAVGCAVLALTLAAQIVWAKRAALVTDPATRAWALGACAKLDCRLPPIRDVAGLELLARDVRAEPGATGTLAITATIRNHAVFRQPWPVVVVELTDLDGGVIAMRRFRPVEYVPNRARRDAGMPPGATAALAFEVADPGKRATGFHFRLE